MGFSSLDEQTPTIEVFEWTDSDGDATFHYGLDPNQSPRRVDLLLAMSTDSVVRKLLVQLVTPTNDSKDAFLINIPVGAGNTTPLYSGLPAAFGQTSPGIILPPMWTIRVGLVNALTSGAVVKLFAIGGIK